MMLWTQVGIEAEVNYRQERAARRARKSRVVRAARTGRTDRPGSTGKGARRPIARWIASHRTA
jgi:hypothetical protein